MATSTGGVNPQLCENSHEAGRTDEIVAEKLGIGSSNTYRKEKYIIDNADTLTPEDFDDWDEGKLSTNKAYLKIKEQLAEKENQIAGYEAKMKRVDELKAKIQGLESVGNLHNFAVRDLLIYTNFAFFNITSTIA